MVKIITAILGILAFIGFLALLWWLSNGPRRCPSCGKLTWGIWGLGQNAMYFRCKICGAEWEKDSN